MDKYVRLEELESWLRKKSSESTLCEDHECIDDLINNLDELEIIEIEVRIKTQKTHKISRNAPPW